MGHYYLSDGTGEALSDILRPIFQEAEEEGVHAETTGGNRQVLNWWGVDLPEARSVIFGLFQR